MLKDKVAELKKAIEYLESEKAYATSVAALLMAEANLIDEQIADFNASGLSINARIRDLKAELSDTV